MTEANTKRAPRLSVVTPTFRRPTEIADLLKNLSEQTLLPFELIMVDGAPAEERETENVVVATAESLPFRCRYLSHDRGTAIQRNAGIEVAEGDYIAFIDDDVRLRADFFEKIAALFAEDREGKVGGIVGFRTNQYFEPQKSERWRWYRRLGLFTVYEPGKYDFKSGYPINASMQAPFSGVRHVDFMTTACAVWRREVMDAGLRFDRFFCDYGVLEDAHFSLRAGRRWELLQCGDAHCSELRSPFGRVDAHKLGYKCVVNYYFVFRDIVQPLTWRHQARFWRYQAFELLRIGASAVRRRRSIDVMEIRGRLEGMRAVLRGLDT